jgi:PAS domain-containing protein
VLTFFSIQQRTERERRRLEASEKAIRESEERYRGMVERINEVIFEVDHQGVLLYFSPVGKDVLGYDEEDVVGMNFIELVHPDDRGIITERFVELSNRAKITCPVLAICCHGIIPFTVEYFRCKNDCFHLLSRYFYAKRISIRIELAFHF